MPLRQSSDRGQIDVGGEIDRTGIEERIVHDARGQPERNSLGAGDDIDDDFAYFFCKFRKLPGR